MARFTEGYVKMWRSIDTSDIGHDGYAKAIFAQLVRWANIQESRIRGVTINRGEVVTSLAQLVEALMFAKSLIHRKIIMMEKYGMLKREMRQQVSVITVCNYDKWNSKESDAETESETLKERDRDAPGTLEERDRDYIEELKNKRIKEVYNSSHQKFLDTWNSNCGSLRKVTVLNEARKRNIRIRLSEEPKLEYWEGCVKRMSASDFCREGNWATFDWLIKNSNNHVKVAEGNYDNRGTAPKTSVLDEWLAEKQAEQKEHEDAV